MMKINDFEKIKKESWIIQLKMWYFKCLCIDFKWDWYIFYFFESSIIFKYNKFHTPHRNHKYRSIIKIKCVMLLLGSFKCEWIQKEIIAYTSVVMVLNNSITSSSVEWLNLTRLIYISNTTNAFVGMPGMWSVYCRCLLRALNWESHQNEQQIGHNLCAVHMAGDNDDLRKIRKETRWATPVITWMAKPLLTTIITTTQLEVKLWEKIVKYRWWCVNIFSAFDDLMIMAFGHIFRWCILSMIRFTFSFFVCLFVPLNCALRPLIFCIIRKLFHSPSKCKYLWSWEQKYRHRLQKMRLFTFLGLYIQDQKKLKNKKKQN